MSALKSQQQASLPETSRPSLAPAGKALSVLGALLSLCGWGTTAEATKSAAPYDFMTSSFGINITVNCSEGNVTCADVSYLGRHLKTGRTLRLRGSTVHALCADKVTPCHLLGYTFRNGAYRYFVGEAPAKLDVFKNGRLILRQKGSWR